ncbi:NAD(P)H-dependent oxidoreductase subunit E [uncultured Desulfobulbus sp.]|uniref:NADH-quinone oxidoreductase subunit NuoE family protein n=1 Tax=uncultured Desulfobulbus sp. TaxID=239745 RepID=UPI0029C97724|nr:NAD(P)H-dependent oxidoreductase subunit E [uncultured Desulfobulbus sp.]
MSCASCTDKSENMQKLCKYISEHRDPVKPQGALIAVLHKAQDTFGFLSPEVMSVVAHELQVPESYVWGVATFYSYFTLKPRGKYPVAVCMGTACYVKGATAILSTIKEQLNIKVGETSDDGLFSLVETRCIGACGLAPIMTVGDEVFGRLTADQVPEILAKYQKMK